MKTLNDINNEIQNLKEKVGQDAENIIANGIPLKRKGKMYHCPNGYKHKRGDRTPSLSWDPKALHFYCFGCNNKIDIYEYYKEYLNYGHYEILSDLNVDSIDDSEINKNIKTFKSESSKIVPLNDKCKGYIKKRGITEETYKAFDVNTFKDNIIFEYYKHDVMVSGKIRVAGKVKGDNLKSWSLKGSKPFLYNANNIDFEKDTIVVCEGEFDAMIIHQSGYKNVVSVGAGANSLESLFEKSEKFFNNFNNIIVVSDNDKAGNLMDVKFLEEFKEKVKLIDKSLYKGNDINEEYFKSGKDKIIKIVESAKLKIEGMRDLEETPYKGLKNSNMHFIPTGIETLDNAINDLGTGKFTLITGRTNGGKTTFCNQLKLNAIDKNFKVLEISGEGLQNILLNDFYSSVIGYDKEAYNFIKVNKRLRKEPKTEVLKTLQRWHKGKYKLFTKGDSKLKSTEELFEMMSSEVKSNKHDLIIIDNLMSILDVSNSSEKNNNQANFAQNCVDFSKAYNVHIILVLHPNKTYSKGQSVEIEHISGTSDLGNKADNVITIIREYEEDEIENGVDGRIELQKNRYYPQLPKIKIKFDTERKIYQEISKDGAVVERFIKWKQYLSDDIDKNTYEKIEVKKDLENSPF